MAVGKKPGRGRKAKAMAELPESIRSLVALQERSPLPFAVNSSDYRFLACNDAFCALVGYSLEELLAMTWKQLTPPDYDHLKHNYDHLKHKIHEELKSGKLPHYEKEYVRKDGSRVFVELFLNLIADKSDKPLLYYTFISDITEQKQAEERLRESEEKYRSIVEQVNDWVWEIDAQGLYSYVSPHVRDLLGYELEEVIGRSPFDFMPPVEAERVRRLFNLIFERREAFSLLENSLARKDGSLVTVETSGTPIYNYQGTLVGYRGIDRDITERKKAEKALMESEKFLNNVFRSIQDGISVLDKDLNIIQVNQTMEKWYVHSMPLVGKKCYEAYHGRSEPCEVCPSLQSIDHKKMESEVVPKVDVSGGVGWVELYTFPMCDKDGNVVSVIEHVRDITERKRVEEALIQSKNYLDRIIDTVADPIFVKDRQHHWILLNDAFCAMIGHSREELLGKSDYDFFPKEQADVFWAKDELVLRRGEENINEELFTDGEGSVHTILTKKALYVDGAGEKTLVGVISDITKRKQMEEALNDAKQQAELYLDLMGHDINNMHQIALGYLEMARDMPPDAGQGKFLDKPIEVLQRSAQLIRNVRKLQKLKEGVFKTQDVDICKMLVDLQREFGAVPHKAITLNLNGCDHCHVRANELLHDVFANLVSNAIKHTGDRADIDIGLDVVNDAGGRYCRVSVEDNGPGIPDDFKANIFNRTLKGNGNAKGMGLGLYLVKSLVESYGGRVWVEDRIAGDHTKGARFVVMLPSSET